MVFIDCVFDRGISMTFYPKTQTLWKRDPKTGIILPGEYSREEFKNIRYWHITEKIDGMNMRIEYKQPKFLGEVLSTIAFKGRTDNAIIPRDLLGNLKEIFTQDRMERQFPDSDSVTLFGEGYGPGIQKGGGLYREDKNFILFDVVVGGWWLEQDSVTQIAEQLGIRRAPVLGIWTEQQAIDFIEQMPSSRESEQHKEIEGVMCRSRPLMLFRNGNPLMFKLKVKDYRNLLML